MPRKNNLAVTSDEEASALLSRKISNVIHWLMVRSQFTQAKFAAAMGLSRTTLNMLLNCERGNTWRLPTLCAAARVLKLPVWEIVRLAESSQGDNVDRNAIDRLLCLSLLRTTEPGSPERLRRLVAQALNILPELDPPEWEAEYRCSPAEIEAGAPQFYRDYTNGALIDEDALGVLEKAFAYMEEHKPCLFWVALQRVYAGK